MTETTPEEEPGSESPFESAPNVDGHEPELAEDPDQDTPPGQADPPPEPTD